jgi:hypothetical protein
MGASSSGRPPPRSGQNECLMVDAGFHIKLGSPGMNPGSDEWSQFSTISTAGFAVDKLRRGLDLTTDFVMNRFYYDYSNSFKV